MQTRKLLNINQNHILHKMFTNFIKFEISYFLDFLDSNLD